MDGYAVLPPTGRFQKFSGKLVFVYPWHAVCALFMSSFVPRKQTFKSTSRIEESAAK
jgi:hypothetical protein